MLRKNLFNKKQEQESTRKGFGDGLVEAGKQKDVWALTADLGGSTCVNNFKEKFPERFVQVGVAEQNLVTVASGIASMNKVAFATSFAAFNPGRNWEQIRTTICYNNQPVIIVGSHTGLGVGEDGATHQALEDIAIMRTLPNVTVIVPCDYTQAKKATIELAKQKKPSYLRLNRQKTPILTKSTTKFKIGEAQVFEEGKDLVIFSTGPIIAEALKAAKELKKQKHDVSVINIHTIKPLDEKTITKYVQKCGKFMSVEDHQIIGGLGSAISEVLIKKGITAKGTFIGMRDEFGESGNKDDLYQKFGLTSERIIIHAKKLLKTKNDKVKKKKKIKNTKQIKKKNSKTTKN